MDFVYSSHTSPAYSSFGTIALIRMHLLIVVSRCESVRIASIFPTCYLSFPINCAVCASQDQYFDISTPRCVHWSAIGTSSSPHSSFWMLLVCFCLCYLQQRRATTHVFLFAVALQLQALQVSSHFVSDRPSGVSGIPTKSSANIKVSTPYLPPRTVNLCCISCW